MELTHPINEQLGNNFILVIFDHLSKEFDTVNQILI